MVIKQRKTETAGEDGEIITPIDEREESDEDEQWRSADSYFPLDVAYKATCGSNLLFRVEI